MKKRTSAAITPGSEKFDRDIKEFFLGSLKLVFKNPSLIPFLLKTYIAQSNAAKIRRKFRNNGIVVPPLMIYSITDKCNLNCSGCYSRAHHREEKSLLLRSDIEKMLEEAQKTGISIVMIGGGEPFLRQDLHEIINAHPDIIFPVFTNATLIDEGRAKMISKTRNLVPVISIEGNARETDERRGEGIYDSFRSAIPLLKKKNIFWGISITVTRANFNVVTRQSFIQELIALGSRLFFFVEYVPVKEDTMDLVLTNDQKADLAHKVSDFSSRFNSMFAALPGDESAYGGCLAAGRGFIHISPSGEIEPCPFAPYSDINIKNTTIIEALEKSRLLSSIRENHSALKETAGGCALWAHREWVRSLLDTRGKASTS
jgi:MoaA/NifB/PqqE/SkfB family radical SAM enzyme